MGAFWNDLLVRVAKRQGEAGNVFPVEVAGSTPTYDWRDTDPEPTPDDPTKLAWGARVNTGTGEIEALYWDGAAWQPKSTSALTSISASQTRPDNTTAYSALQVVGTNPATNMAFATGLNAGSGFVVLGARLRIDAAAIPAGMTGFRLHLYNAAPTPIVDGASFNVIAADRAKYLGYIEIFSVQDVGETLWAQATSVNLTGKLAAASATLYGVLETRAGFTPTASMVKTLTINVAPL